MNFPIDFEKKFQTLMSLSEYDEFPSLDVNTINL